MAVLVICLFLPLAAGLVAIYRRLAPGQAVQVERIARQGAQEGRGSVRVTQGEELIIGLRSLINELVATAHLEPNAANERYDQLQAERASWEALRAQLSAERSVSEALCGQHNTARIALEKLCLELNAERANLLDTVYRAFGPARVDHAVATINARRAQERTREEETKPEGLPMMRRATPDRERPDSPERERTQGERLASLRGEDPLKRAQATILPTTREDLEKQREFLAATAAGDSARRDAAASPALSNAASVTALEVGAGGATLSPWGAPRAVHSGAVAPPASAPTPLAPEHALQGTGLGEAPQGPHGARPPSRSTGTKTMTGMPAMCPAPPTDGTPSERSSPPTQKQGGADRSALTPAGSAAHGPVSTTAHVMPTSASSSSATWFFEDENDEERERKRDTDVGAPPRTPKPGNEDGEPTELLVLDPAALQHALRTPVREGLSGVAGVPEAAPRRPHASYEEMPRKSRMTALEAGK